MEFAEHTLYDNQELQLLQVQDLQSTYTNDLIEQELIIQAILLEYQNNQKEHYETTLKTTVQETQQKPVQLAPEAEEEGVLSAKELKNLKAWKSQKRFGTFVEGTNILPCKTFLCEEKWFDYLGSDEHFHIRDLINHLNNSGLKIGLILDLNRSTTYYDFKKVQSDSPLLSETKYKKFKLENGAVPCEEAVQEVCKLLQEAHEKGEVAVVHCFNGLNRTGYMICEFMCRNLGVDGETAIRRFEEARQHRIEHECMTVELKNKYPKKE